LPIRIVRVDLPPHLGEQERDHLGEEVLGGWLLVANILVAGNVANHVELGGGNEVLPPVFEPVKENSTEEEG
jgi:hypothetical protein